jgi:VanZ family protein
VQCALGSLLLALVFSLGASSLNAQEPARDRDSLTESSRDRLPDDRWLAPDKAAHVFGGYWTASVGYAAASALDGDSADRRTAAVAAGLAAGLAKEAFDAFVQHERASWRDLVADVVGVVLLVAVTAAAES